MFATVAHLQPSLIFEVSPVALYQCGPLLRYVLAMLVLTILRLEGILGYALALLVIIRLR